MRILLLVAWCWVFALSETTFFTNDPVFHATTPVHTAGNPNNPPVVLVHGLGDEASSIWEATARFLEKEFYVVRFDLPGFGEASKGNHLYSPQNYSTFIHHLTKHYLGRPFHLIGHSMGAAIALQYTHTYSTDVRSLVLISAAGILHHKAYSNFIIDQKVENVSEEPLLGQHLPTHAIGRFLQRVSTSANTTAVDPQSILNSEKLRQTLLGGNPASIAALALAHTNFNGIPEHILQNTTLIWGEKDDVAPLQTGYVLHKRMPNVAFFSIQEAGHLPLITHEKTFFTFLENHFHHFTPTPWRAPHQSDASQTGTLQHANNHILTGTFETLAIYNSRNVLIRDAHIRALSIVNSDVRIENSAITLLEEPMRLQNAQVAITASTLTGHVHLHASTLNLAGVSLQSGTQEPFVVSRPSRFIYSLCTINGHLVHGQETR
ncbi:MAG: alpha/beta hydrolase [Campylobacterales bacterium]|nr:alpha/beta hydrolase [Campylobacterales bacterium]